MQLYIDLSLSVFLFPIRKWVPPKWLNGPGPIELFSNKQSPPWRQYSYLISLKTLMEEWLQSTWPWPTSEKTELVSEPFGPDSVEPYRILGLGPVCVENPPCVWATSLPFSFIFSSFQSLLPLAEPFPFQCFGFIWGWRNHHFSCVCLSFCFLQFVHFSISMWFGWLWQLGFWQKLGKLDFLVTTKPWVSCLSSVATYEPPMASLLLSSCWIMFWIWEYDGRGMVFMIWDRMVS